MIEDPNRTIEIKVRYTLEQTWEAQPVAKTVEITPAFPYGVVMTAEMEALEVFKANPTCREVRWNWLGSSQGHYLTNWPVVFGAA